MMDPKGKCERVESDVLLDHVQGRLAQSEAAEIDQHLAGCDDCRRQVEELQAILALTAAPPIEPSREADEAVRNAIKAAAPSRTLKPVRPAPRRPRSRRVSAEADAPVGVRIFWGMAAAFFLAIAVYYVASSWPEGPTSEPPSADTGQPEVPPPPTPETQEEVKPIPAVEDSEPPAPPPGRVDQPQPEPPLPPPPVAPGKPEPPRETPQVAQKPEEEERPTVAEIPMPFGRIVRLSGVSEGSHDENRILSLGRLLFSGESITCRRGSMVLELTDGSLVAAKGGTKFTPRSEGDDAVIELTSGEVACSVRRRPERRFVVQTRHGKATVKGTIFSVKINGSTVVTVSRGTVEASTSAGARDVTAGERVALRKSSSPSKPERTDASRYLSWAFDAGLRSLDTIWIAAADSDARLQAPMARDRLFARGSLSGAPVCARTDSRTLPSWTGRTLKADRDVGGWVEYTVDLPETGNWYLWGRMLFPGSGTQLWSQKGKVPENDPNSFFVRIDGNREQVFGNLRRESSSGPSWYRRWHWGGDGSEEIGRPRPLSLGKLDQGRHTLRVRNRDAVETTTRPLAPRLDALCLTLDPNYVPRDEDFSK